MLKLLFFFCDPLLCINRFIGLIFLFIYRFRKNIEIENGVVFKGIPILQCYDGSILIGNKSTLYSTPYGYFAHFTNRTRLFVEDGGKIIIGSNVRINGSTIHARQKIKIGNNSLVAANTSIIDSNGHPLSTEKPEKRGVEKDEPSEIIIGNNVWIGLNCIILKGVHIGDGAVISAGTVVNKDIPMNALAYGNPVQIRCLDD